MPFGIVKSEDKTTKRNGKSTTIHSELLEFGLSGATSAITQEPVDSPDLNGIFGG